jgi:hypothetical protein
MLFAAVMLANGLWVKSPQIDFDQLSRPTSL